MRVIKTKDYKELSRAAANIISAQILLKPDCVLGLATGSSPVGAYQQLIEWYKKGDLDFSQVTTVNLDEYVGLKRDHDQSYYYFMHHNLFDSVNLRPGATNLPDGCAADMAAECVRYDTLLRSLGVDLQLLGLGNNGHIGFNEPDEEFSKGTHVVTLTESTLEANKRFFASIDDVPKTAISMGTYDIMQAKRVLMVASGKAKAQAVKAMLTGPITPKMPASILQFHRDFTLVADEEALSLL